MWLDAKARTSRTPSPVQAGSPDRFVRNKSGVAFRRARRGPTRDGRHPRRPEGRDGWLLGAECPGAWRSRRPRICRAPGRLLAKRGAIRQARARRPRMIMSRSFTLRLRRLRPGSGPSPCSHAARAKRLGSPGSKRAGRRSGQDGLVRMRGSGSGRRPRVVSSRVLRRCRERKSSSFRPHAHAYGRPEYSNIVTGRQFAPRPAIKRGQRMRYHKNHE